MTVINGGRRGSGVPSLEQLMAGLGSRYRLHLRANVQEQKIILSVVDENKVVCLLEAGMFQDPQEVALKWVERLKRFRLT